jgi:pyridoxamine-phosphate oxidase
MSDTVPRAEPFTRFNALLAEAVALGPERIQEPTSFALGTVDDDGQPSVRIVLLKAVDERGFVFYTNYESRKGRALLAQPRAAMCFHWQPMERQVRGEGDVTHVSADEADAYFASRPRGSQEGAWASLQSQPIATPGDFESRLAEVQRRYAYGPVPRPPHWSGFRIVPRRIEFWHGMPSRLHERDVYVLDGERWRTEVLYP